MQQQSLLDWVPIGGTTFNHTFDAERLACQARKVYDLMRDSQWRTLSEIRELISQPEASISARLRDLRKLGLTVERRRRGNPKQGIHEYRVHG